VRDRVRYSLPFGLLGEVAHVLFVQRDLDNVFAYRRAAVDREL
jgi:ligand-binding SRPBCC domain-containing protein